MLKKSILILILVFALSACNSAVSNQEPSNNPAETIQDTTPEAGESAEQVDSNYQTYNLEAFEANADKNRVLFFHANWCPTCKVANEDFTSNSDQIPDDVVIFRTDYDSETELKDKYEITYQHTFVHVDSRGDVISKWNGGGLTRLIEMI